MMSTKCSQTVYKGHPCIVLDSESKYPFTFGLAKAKLVLEHLEAIRAFVKANSIESGDRFDMAVEDSMKERCGL